MRREEPLTLISKLSLGMQDFLKTKFPIQGIIVYRA